MRSSADSLRLAGIALALVLALFAGQALAATSAPAGGIASTGRVMGQTGFAYLGGLRTFAAAVLWGRLEPIYDGYYPGVEVSELTAFLPTMRLVIALDPQFEQAFYNAAWIVARQGRIEDGIAVARDGVAKNPDSGLLHANLVQLLIIQDKKRNLDEAYKIAVFGLGPKARWANLNDQVEGYGIFRTVFQLRGDEATVAQINAAQKKLQVQIEAAARKNKSNSTPGGN